jgi:hypothetical protein
VRWSAFLQTLLLHVGSRYLAGVADETTCWRLGATDRLRTAWSGTRLNDEVWIPLERGRGDSGWCGWLLLHVWLTLHSPTAEQPRALRRWAPMSLRDGDSDFTYLLA